MGIADILGQNPMTNALSRRGINPAMLMQQAPLMTQITPSSPNFDPNMSGGSAFPSVPMPDRSPMTMMQHAQMSSPQAQPAPAQHAPISNKPPKWTPKNEAEFIVNALAERLDGLGQLQQSPQPVTPPTAQPAPAGMPYGQQ